MQEEVRPLLSDLGALLRLCATALAPKGWSVPVPAHRSVCRLQRRLSVVRLEEAEGALWGRAALRRGVARQLDATLWERLLCELHCTRAGLDQLTQDLGAIFGLFDTPSADGARLFRLSGDVLKVLVRPTHFLIIHLASTGLRALVALELALIGVGWGRRCRERSSSPCRRCSGRTRAPTRRRSPGHRRWKLCAPMVCAA